MRTSFNSQKGRAQAHTSFYDSGYDKQIMIPSKCLIPSVGDVSLTRVEKLSFHCQKQMLATELAVSSHVQKVANAAAQKLKPSKHLAG